MPNGEVVLSWGDGDHAFNIAKIAQTLELEEKCDAGLPELLIRINEGKWRLNDLRETLRLGLIGGGKSPIEALKLIKKYFDERPFAESVPEARVILMAALFGVPGGEQPGKGPAGRAKTESDSTTEADSSDPLSMGSALDLAGIHVERTKQPSGN